MKGQPLRRATKHRHHVHLGRAVVVREEREHRAVGREHGRALDPGAARESRRVDRLAQITRQRGRPEVTVGDEHEPIARHGGMHRVAAAGRRRKRHGDRCRQRGVRAETGHDRKGASHVVHCSRRSVIDQPRRWRITCSTSSALPITSGVRACSSVGTSSIVRLVPVELVPPACSTRKLIGFAS